jgi:hypothetical protein
MDIKPSVLKLAETLGVDAQETFNKHFGFVAGLEPSDPHDYPAINTEIVAFMKDNMTKEEILLVAGAVFTNGMEQMDTINTLKGIIGVHRMGLASKIGI